MHKVFPFLAAFIVAMSAYQASAQAPLSPINEVAQGYAYYHRAGATLDSLKDALAGCSADTVSIDPNGRPISGDPSLSIASNIMMSGIIGGRSAVRLENCMIVRGWSVYELPEAIGAPIVALDQAGFERELGALVLNPAPAGTLFRRWDNDSIRPALLNQVALQRSPSGKHLMFRLLTAIDSDRAVPTFEHFPQRVRLDRFLRASDLPMPEPGGGIIVVRVRGGSNKFGPGMWFLEDKPYTGALTERIRFFQTMVGTLFQKREGSVFAMSVPAGRWQVAGIGIWNYCLGAPSFEVEAGTVVFAGSFDISGENVGPDLDMTPVLSMIDGPGGQLLRPAAYRNGSVFPCASANTPYGLEVPGAPFAEGYSGGSVATQPPASAGL